MDSTARASTSRYAGGVSIDSRWEAVEGIWRLTPGETFDLGDVLDLLGQTDWKGAKRFLWDIRGLARGPDASGDLRQLQGEIQRSIAQWEGSRVAIVVTTDFHYGIARMFTSFAVALDMDYQVFREETVAREWLREHAG